MAQYNDDKEEAEYVLSAEQFVASAMDSAQIANLFSLGSISADDAKSAAADAEGHEGNAAAEEPAPAPSKRAAPAEAAKPKPTTPAGNAGAGDVGMRGIGRGAPTAGRGMPPPAGRGGM